MNLTEENATLRSQNEVLQLTVQRLEEQLEWFKKRLFGKSSEKKVRTIDAQLLLFELPKKEEPTKEKQIVKGHQRVKPKRNGQDAITLPPNLPVERIVKDLPENEKVCAKTGVPLVKIGEEISRKLARAPASYYIIEIVRPKYAHPKDSDQGIKAAELPPSLLPRCQVDDSFLADLLVKKYADHLPLYRVSEILDREKIGISRQTLSQWVLKCARALRPLYDEMLRQTLKNQVLFADETPVKMLDPGAGKTKFTFMWVLAGGKGIDPPYIVYNFREDRKHHHAEEFLKNFRGVVHSDKYGAYEKMAQAKQFLWCPCWAHVRRKFVDATSGDNQLRTMVLEKIQELFHLEDEGWTKSPEERLQCRRELQTPIIDELILAIKDRRINGRIIPRSNFKEALDYFLGLTPYLKNYISHPFARLDNNVAERAIRPIALGRKNWLFLGNSEGGEAAAVILSLVQTCRAMEINPRAYLEDVMRKLMDYNALQIADLLPDNWLKSQST